MWRVGTLDRSSAVGLSPEFLTAGGIASGVSCFYLLLTETPFINGAMPEYLMEVLLVGVPAVGLCYAGYWLSSEGFDPERVYRIGGAAVGGVLLAAAVTAAFLVSVPPSAIGARGTFFLLVAAGTEGALIAVLVGVLRTADLLSMPHQDNVRRLETVNAVLRHNLRNRLTIMSGHLGLIDRGDDERHFETIESQHEAIRSLLDHTELTSEAARESELEAVDLGSVVSEQVRHLEASYDGVDVSASVPDGTGVWADDLLAPMLENLLLNAVSHCDRETVSVNVRAVVNGDAVTLSVADDGPGIPDERKADVLCPEVGDGGGMGLYLVETITSRYGGDLSIADSESGGARVNVTLRRHERAA